jgi:LysM repeat protein
MDAQHAIDQGIAAARANNQRTAYYYFYVATQADPNNEQAWLWRASTAPHPRDALFCLAAVLAINPHNPVARHGLDQISAAVAAQGAPAGYSITPSVSPARYKPPERRLEWRQTFQRDGYDMARAPRMEPVDPALDEEPAPLPPAPVAPAPTYLQPAPGRGERFYGAVRRLLVDRDQQRVQFAIPAVIAVVLIIGAVAALGWGEVGRTPAAPLPGPSAAPPSPTQVSAAPPTAPPATMAPTLAPPTTAPIAAATAPPTAAPTDTVAVVAPTATTAPPPPTDTPPPAPTNTAAPPPTNTAPPPPTNTAAPPPPTRAPLPPTAVPQQTLTLRAGQTLPQVATQRGISLGALMAYNGISNLADTGAGTLLKLPPASYQPATARYVVQPNDNLTHIADLFDVSIPAITARNGMSNPNQIYPGQTLIIPLQ